MMNTAEYSYRRAWRTVAIGVAIAVAAPGCRAIFGPKGNTTETKRATVRKERDAALEELFAARPGARAKIARAAGYGVFSNLNVHLFMLSNASGYGVVVDNRRKKETFMRMASIGGGVGLGVKDFRAVFIFNDADVLRKFVDFGWQFGGEADAAAKAGDEGVAGNVAVGFDHEVQPIEIYQLTKTGVSLQATVAGTKYWKDDALNK